MGCRAKVVGSRDKDVGSRDKGISLSAHVAA